MQVQLYNGEKYMQEKRTCLPAWSLCWHSIIIPPCTLPTKLFCQVGLEVGESGILTVRSSYKKNWRLFQGGSQQFLAFPTTTAFVEKGQGRRDALRALFTMKCVFHL